jgi:hypothetical protein
MALRLIQFLAIMESTLMLPRVTKAAENLESRAAGEGSNPACSTGESGANG